ncbi:unnamed protein product, partial [Iphiclides podalirius]
MSSIVQHDSNPLLSCCTTQSTDGALPISDGRETTAGPGLAASAAIGPRRFVGVQGFWRTPIDEHEKNFLDNADAAGRKAVACPLCEGKAQANKDENIPNSHSFEALSRRLLGSVSK